MVDSSAPRHNSSDNNDENSPVRLLVAGGGATLMLLAGIILQSAFGAEASLCNSPLGTLEQLDGDVSDQAGCAGVTVADTLGVTFTWIGAVGLGLLALVAIFTFVGQEKRPA